jgi:hypothetical protein
MKTFWRIGLSCLVWTCTGIATAASATPYTFNESSNADAVNNRAPVYPIYTDSSNSGLPDALMGNEGPIQFKNSQNLQNSGIERTASNQPFMKEVAPGGRDFSPNGGSITSTSNYRFSEASPVVPVVPVEEWYGNRLRGQGGGRWQGQGRRHNRNRNRNFQGGGFQSARGLNNNFDFINNANNNNNNNFGAASFRASKFNNANLSSNTFNNNNFGNSNFGNSTLGNNNFNNPNRNNKRNRNRNPDPTADVKQPDRVADNPQVDGDGVRHFSNGKHLDLSKMSLDAAIGATNASGENPIPNNARN